MQASYNVTQYGGGIVLRGKDYATSVLESMVLAVNTVSRAKVDISLREKTQGNLNIDLDSDSSMAQYANVKSIDHFNVAETSSGDNSLLVPSMRKEIRQIVSGDPDFSYIPQDEIGVDGQNTFCKLLADLSEISFRRGIDNEPFAPKVRQVIFDRIKGKYSAGIFLNGSKSNIVLASRDFPDPPSIGLLLTKSCAILMWYGSSRVEQEFMQTMFANSRDAGMPPVFIPFTTVEDSAIVLNPQFLTSKWAKLRTRALTADGTASSNMTALNVFLGHILHITMSIQDTK